MNAQYKIITYGCQMNVHESEKIAGMLRELGYVETTETDDANVIVFNTCCIRDTAEKKALGNIGAVKHLKKTNKGVIIAVVGCMPQQEGYAEILSNQYAHVDIILGTSNLDKLPQLIIEKLQKGKRVFDIDINSTAEINENVAVYRTSGSNAWVNIMYGCNNFCSYCIVPFVRGRERSRKKEDIFAEVSLLLEQGYKEITLLGQNVNSYGNDKNDGYHFSDLLKDIAEIDKRFRLRFMTSHPKDLTDDVIDMVAKYKNICSYIHLPVQSGSSKVLSDMNRKYTKEHYVQLIAKIKSKVPNVGISTDIMVGFPTESDDDFLETLDLVKKCRFSTAFTFVYSPRKGTAAASMVQIPYAIKKQRITALIEVQNQITKEISNEYIGKSTEILVESYNEEKSMCCGRTESGRLVRFEGAKDLVGQFLQITITKAKSATLIGKITSTI